MVGSAVVSAARLRRRGNIVNGVLDGKLGRKMEGGLELKGIG